MNINGESAAFGNHIEAILKFQLGPDALRYAYHKFQANNLINSLSGICKYAFDQDFNDFASKNNPFFSILQVAGDFLKKSDIMVNKYNHNFFDSDGMQLFLNKYPEIVSVIQNKIHQSNKFLAEVISNVENDTFELAKQFNKGREMGSLVDIKLAQGDCHQSGKSTAIVEFDCGLKIVYKPKSGSMDLAFNSFLKYLTIKTGVLFKTAKVYDKGTYFWMEFIEHVPVYTTNQLNLYYVRCGALLAVCYLLGGTDFHHENIIANGEFPILIDVECLFGASDEMLDGKYNIYNTGLVPISTYEGKDGNFVDSSGFGAFGKQVSGIEGWKWVDYKSDAQRLQKLNGSFIAKENQPVFNNKIIEPNSYLTNIIEGFKKIGKFFVKHRSERLTFQRFENKSVRIVIRNTVDYVTTLENSYNTNVLTSPKRRNQCVSNELISLQPITYLPKELKALIVQAEIETLCNLNIPFFRANTSLKNIYESDKLIFNNFFKISPYEFTISRIQRFDYEDLNRQICLLQSAFKARYEATPKLNALMGEDSQMPIKCQEESIESAAQEIYLKLKESAIKKGNSYLWVNYTSTSYQKFEFSSLTSSFYDGTLGICYYLHVLDDYNKTKKNSKIIASIIISEIEKYKIKGDNIDVSFSTGLAGLLYVLIKTENHDNENLSIATSLIRLIKRDTILNDSRYDIMSGTAGLLMSMCLLFRKTFSDEIKELMLFIGDFLLDSRIVDSKSGFKTWKSDIFERPLTGFSHGASGIGCALVNLYDCVKREEYKDAFYESILFENFYMVENQSNWADLRSGKNISSKAWCHGAPGIGLSRLYAYRILQDSNLLKDIDMAINSTKHNIIEDIDFYCCGNVGKIDFLIECSRILNAPDLLDFAKASLIKIIKKRDTQGYFNTYETASLSFENPSLFRGISGIGYTFIRSISEFNTTCIGLIC